MFIPFMASGVIGSASVINNCYGADHVIGMTGSDIIKIHG